MASQRKSAFAEESAEVEVLFANMEKLKALTKKIQGSMNRLETSGKNVQSSVAPMYGNTKKLQVTNSNIDKAIETIERLRAPLERTLDEEHIIRSEPRRTGIPEYISSLDRANRALVSLRASQLKTNQKAINEMSALVKFGSRQLEEAYKSILRQESSTPVEPLHFITKDKPFPTLPMECTSELRIINRYMFTYYSQQSPQSGSGEYPTFKIYADVRGEHMSRSLRNLATASVATARKTNPEALYKRGTSGIGTYSSGLEGMIMSEFESIRSTFVRDEWGPACLATCRSPLNEFGKTIGELNTQVQNNLMTDCYLGFEIVEITSSLISRLDQQIPELKQPLTDIMRPIRDTSRSALPRMVDDARGRVQALPTLSPEGSAVSVTVETLNRLQSLAAYIQPISALLATLGDGGWSQPSPTTSSSFSTPSVRSFDVGAEGNQLFSRYASDVLEVLMGALDSRARLLLKTTGVQSVFMLNNIDITRNMTRFSELNPLMPGFGQKIDQWQSKHLKVYLNSWNPATTALMDVQYTNRNSRPASGGAPQDSTSIVKGLSSKERENIKEKFRSFNVAFDDLVARHKSYRMEKDVRVLLSRELQRVIEPLYGRFWDRYHDIDKGKGKYVKYDKQALASVFAGLATQ